MKPPDVVTIAEIVQHAGMTPAAFYYHFKSREELLQEVVDLFADEWATLAEEVWGEVKTIEDVLEAVGRLLDWAAENRQRAAVYFVTSKGATMAVESTRQTVTARTSTAAEAAICRATGSRAGARTALDGVALVTVLGSALATELSLDPTYRTLGPRRFRDEVLELSARVLGAKHQTA